MLSDPVQTATSIALKAALESKATPVKCSCDHWRTRLELDSALIVCELHQRGWRALYDYWERVGGAEPEIVAVFEAIGFLAPLAKKTPESPGGADQ